MSKRPNFHYLPEERNPRNRDVQKITILKETREGKGLSLEAVHEATKIPLDALRAIEDGYSVRSLSPFYYRGFVKIYAEYLNVDVSSVIGESKVREFPRATKSSVPDFDFQQWAAKIFTRERKRQLVIICAAVLAFFIVSKIFGFIVHKWPAKSENKNILKEEPVKAKKIKEKNPEVSKEKEKREVPKPVVKEKEVFKPVESKVVETVAVVSEIKEQTAHKSITLTARAKKGTWLRVKADDDVVFQSTLEMGAVETWIANQKIEISGKNLNQLELELNGKMLGPLGRDDRQAKTIVVTKDGLTVTK